ncbi:hypothetical protein RF55_18946 [Lasius niger]|uniref:Uncharacterized protein n=1 Tax=Lasius niger TaxID=67767 RepID=A0A0J7MTN1_LASNI|nr:hypothetical protein RF55_18946 [Lasius niger]
MQLPQCLGGQLARQQPQAEPHALPGDQLQRQHAAPTTPAPQAQGLHGARRALQRPMAVAIPVQAPPWQLLGSPPAPAPGEGDGQHPTQPQRPRPSDGSQHTAAQAGQRPRHQP